MQVLEDNIRRSKIAYWSSASIGRDRKITKIKKHKLEENHLYVYFKWQSGEITHEKSWTLLLEWNHKRAAESLSTSAQANTIMTNYVKVKIHDIQQWSRLCRERDGTINGIASECSRLKQNEYMSQKIDRKGIHLESWTRLNFDHTTKWYIHQPEFVQENET